MNYPSTLPPPLRSSWDRDLDFQVDSVQMQSGYSIDRRREPYIFRQLDILWDTRIAQFQEWWDWANRYGFTWHMMMVQGETYEIRYISEIQFQYKIFGRVAYGVKAEVKLIDTEETWGGSAPSFYDPPINDADGTVGGSTPDIDLNEAFAPYSVTLASVPAEYTLRTSVRVNGIGSIYVDSGYFALWSSDGLNLLGDSTTGVLKFHTNPNRNDAMLKLVAGEDYLLRISGTVGDSVRIWGTTVWQ